MANNTVVSWLIFLALVGFYGYYLSRKAQPAPVRQPFYSPPSRETKQKKGGRERKAHGGGGGGGGQGLAVPAVFASGSSSSDDDKEKNAEFARQLTMARSGAVTLKKSAEKKIKSVKQSRAMEKPLRAENSSVPSSTAGIDADDDQSAGPSPVAEGSDTVDDSAEAEAAPGQPNTIRVTGAGTTKPDEQKAEAATNAAQSKKQRQRVKKREQQRSVREENEQERLKKLAEQRRAATHDAVPAATRNESSRAATFQASPAWAPKEGDNSARAGAAKEAAAAGPAPASQDPTTEAATPGSVGPTDWMSGLPSEEQQLSSALEADAEEEWSTVETKFSRRKHRGGAAAGASASAAAAAAAVAETAAARATTPGGNRHHGQPAHRKNEALANFAHRSPFAALDPSSGSSHVSVNTIDFSSEDTKPSRAGEGARQVQKAAPASEEEEWDI